MSRNLETYIRRQAGWIFTPFDPAKLFSCRGGAEPVQSVPWASSPPIRAQRKKIVAANMPLTETEATKFWPLYDRYVAETIKINDARFALIKEYAQNYSDMSDAQADDFIKRWIAFDGDSTQLRLKYIPEFEKVISHKKTALFFQMDRRLSMMVELQLASQVPVVKP